MRWLVIGLVAAGLWLPACDLDSPPLIDGLFTDAEWQKIASFTPLPPVPPSPTNRFADDPRAAALGQRLWFEKRYAGPITQGSRAAGGLGEIGEIEKVACASCHDPEHWFTDTRAMNQRSLGASWTRRNTPSIVNAVFYAWGNWAGSHDQVWKQAVTLPENKDVFNGNRLRYAHVIYEHHRDEYNALFDPDLDPALDPADTSGRFPPSGRPKGPDAPDGAWEMMTEEDRFIVDTILVNCGKALEAYQRRLVSTNAPFDRYVAGDRGALGASAKRGLKLFVGKAACDACHQQQTFTDQKFHNTGVTQTVTPMDLGHFADVPRLEDVFNGAGLFSDDRIAGAAKLDSIARTQAEEMQGQFRTKSLRHVAQTAPYFHHGSMPTLVDVVRFYNDGGGADGTYPGVKDERLVPLNLTEPEIHDLVAFLEALTGDPVPEDLTRNLAAFAPATRRAPHITAE